MRPRVVQRVFLRGYPNLVSRLDIGAPSEITGTISSNAVGCKTPSYHPIGYIARR